MSDTTSANDVSTTDISSAAVVSGIVGGLAVFAILVLLGMSRNAWGFEYALDDVYIHLAMAEQIADGGYGINPGELASAASSPLYPLILVPFSGTDLQRWLPLFWNVLALAVSGAFIGRAFATAGLGRIGVALAAFAPFALATYVTAFTGMENMAHVAASLAIVLGLWRFVEHNEVGWLLITGIILSSAFRLEGLALGMAAGGVVFVLGKPKIGLTLIALSVFPVAIFAGLLVSLGLDPLPNSVLAKLGHGGGGGPLAKLTSNYHTHGGRYLLILATVVLLMGATTLTKDRRRGYFALAVAAAAYAHLMFGSVGWMDRYETYANASLVAALALMLSTSSPMSRALIISIALLGGVATYARFVLPVYAWNPAAITGQQVQLGRFAKDHFNAPVAVNDIGFVAWRNPNHVLDLWGLASPEALALRKGSSEEGWGGPLVSERGTKLVMIYDDWLGEAVPKEWQRLGVLSLDIPSAFLGSRDVMFYAATPDAVEPLKAALNEWMADLPPRASFAFAEVSE